MKTATLFKRNESENCASNCLFPSQDKASQRSANLACSSIDLVHNDCLQYRTGILEVKFKSVAFATWSTYFVRLEGRWLCMYKREQDLCRVGGVELGAGAHVSKCTDEGFVHKTTTQITIACCGGKLSKFEVKLKAKSLSERDDWIAAISNNIHLLQAHGRDPYYGLSDLTQLIHRMKNELELESVRIDGHTAVRCALGRNIVSFIVENRALDRAHAIDLGERLVCMNVLHHISWIKDFGDNAELYVVDDVSSIGSVLQHFQKQLDARRFWKYIDIDPSSCGAELEKKSDYTDTLSRYSLLSSKADKSCNATRNRSVSGVGGNMSRRNVDMSCTHNDCNGDETEVSCETHSSRGDLEALKKSKRCNNCEKSFNPLRRRYQCRSCDNIVCGNCSVSKKVNGLTDCGTSRICGSCKFDSLPENGSSTKVEDSTLFSAIRIDEECSFHSVASSSLDISKECSSGSHMSSRCAAATDLIPNIMIECPSCYNTKCCPLTKFSDVNYPCYKQHDASIQQEYLITQSDEHEEKRLRTVNILIEALRNQALLKVLDKMVSMAAIATQCPMAAIGILDAEKYIFYSHENIPGPAILERKIAFASHTCRSKTPLVCSDLSFDCRFGGNPWRCNQSLALFYAAVPLYLSNGHIVGAFEVFDTKARLNCIKILEPLQAIARGVMKKLNEVSERQSANRSPQRNIGQQNYVRTVSRLDEDTQDSFSRKSKESTLTENQREQTQPDVVPTAAPSAVSLSTTSSSSSNTSVTLSQSDMETKLIELLNQTTDTQNQIRNQQGHMVQAISQHSVQIQQLTQQLEQMEQTLVAKLGNNQEFED